MGVELLGARLIPLDGHQFPSTIWLIGWFRQAIFELNQLGMVGRLANVEAVSVTGVLNQKIDGCHHGVGVEHSAYSEHLL